MLMYSIRARLDAVKKAIKKLGVDSLLVFDIINVRYLTGFTGSSGFLYITHDHNVFITDFRYKEQAQKEIKGWDIIIESGNRIKIIDRLIKKTSSKITGFESSISYNLYRKLTKSDTILRDVDCVIEHIRLIKQEEEIAKIKKAVERAENAFLETKPFIREGQTELQLANLLEERLKKQGCRCLPFDIIVASGPNSAMPHAKPTNRRFQKGDMIIIDWGGEADGYFSDMTRTFILKGGKDYRKKTAIYNIVFRANQKSVSSVKPGINSRKIDTIAREYIKEKGFGNYFGHGTGHGVGLQVHEAPRITWNQSTILKNNMVFTIEPGIYIPELGGVRIEDMVVVKEEGCEVLTQLPKKLEII